MNKPIRMHKCKPIDLYLMSKKKPNSSNYFIWLYGWYDVRTPLNNKEEEGRRII